MPNFSARVKKLRQLIRRSKADALLVTNFVNVTYLTGFTGDDSYLLVTLDGETLISDERYTLQLSDECPELDVVSREPGQLMLPTVADLVAESGIDRLGVEAGSMTVGLQAALAEFLPEVAFEPASNLVETLRIKKDNSEIEATRLACRQAERAFHVVRALITPETTEKDIAAELEYQARRAGAKGLSFPPIVAVGPRAALPHAHPTSKKVVESPFTLIDWGANSGLYVSDLTRMIAIGKLSQKFQKIYQVVLDAQLAAIDAIKPGATCDHVDSVARGIITKARYGKYFGHGLGHGTGLEIHESPRLARGQEKVKLEPGMIITVEPGIYLPEWGGIRIEDDILVTKTGHEVLSNVPKQLDDCYLS